MILPFPSEGTPNWNISPVDSVENFQQHTASLNIPSTWCKRGSVPICPTVGNPTLLKLLQTTWDCRGGTVAIWGATMVGVYHGRGIKLWWVWMVRVCTYSKLLANEQSKQWGGKERSIILFSHHQRGPLNKLGWTSVESDITGGSNTFQFLWTIPQRSATKPRSVPFVWTLSLLFEFDSGLELILFW